MLFTRPESATEPALTVVISDSSVWPFAFSASMTSARLAGDLAHSRAGDEEALGLEFH